MSESRVDRSKWKPLLPSMNAAIDAFDQWSRNHLADVDARNKVTAPLYHYTDASGLLGIVSNEEIWFTDYAHLNDPKEIKFGMEVAAELLNEIGAASDPKIDMYCKMVVDLFTHENLRGAFGFYIASFSRDGDDLGQWRGYGDDGRGYALGLAPHLFHPTENLKPNPADNFVVLPVAYGKQEGRQWLMPAIERSVRLAGEIVLSEASAMRDVNVGMHFFDEMAKALIASELLLNCLLIKHEAYRHEQEVRLVIVGEHKNLTAHVATRARRREIVPFIRTKFPLRDNEGIADVVVGPSSASSAEDDVRALLGQAVRVRRSEIPYRSC